MTAHAERSSTDLIRLWFNEVWNNRRLDMIDEIVGENWVSHGLPHPGAATMSPRDAFKQLYKSYLEAFPDISIAISQIHGDGDMASAHCVVTATHTGNGLVIPATNRPVTFTGSVMVRCEGGRVVENWDSWNIHDMQAQLGLVAKPAQKLPA
jgi:predicted ester cyclase